MLLLRVRTSSIPGTKQVDTSRKEPSLKEAQHCSKRRKLSKVGHETHANHDCAPRKSNRSEVKPGTNPTNKYSRRRLKKGVCDEED